VKEKAAAMQHCAALLSRAFARLKPCGMSTLQPSKAVGSSLEKINCPLTWKHIWIPNGLCKLMAWSPAAK